MCLGKVSVAGERVPKREEAWKGMNKKEELAVGKKKTRWWKKDVGPVRGRERMGIMEGLLEGSAEKGEQKGS